MGSGWLSMSYPAVEAAQRAWEERYSDRLQSVTYSAQHDGMGALAIAAAREALKPIQAWFHWWSHTHRASLPDYAWDHLAKAIFSSEELGQ